VFRVKCKFAFRSCRNWFLRSGWPKRDCPTKCTPLSPVLSLRSPHVGHVQCKRYGTLVRAQYSSDQNICDSTPSSHVLSLRSPHVGHVQCKRYGTLVRAQYSSDQNICDSTPSSHVLSLRSPHVGHAQCKRYGTLAA
jgi:hypothetical protein